MSGAAVGALVALHQPASTPALLLVPLVLVIAVASRTPQEPAVKAPATSSAEAGWRRGRTPGHDRNYGLQGPIRMWVASLSTTTLTLG